MRMNLKTFAGAFEGKDDFFFFLLRLSKLLKLFFFGAPGDYLTGSTIQEMKPIQKEGELRDEKRHP